MLGTTQMQRIDNPKMDFVSVKKMLMHNLIADCSKLPSYFQVEETLRTPSWTFLVSPPSENSCAKVAFLLGKI